MIIIDQIRIKLRKDKTSIEFCFKDEVLVHKEIGVLHQGDDVFLELRGGMICELDEWVRR